MRKANLDKLEEILGYHFENPALLTQAITHTSYAFEMMKDGKCSNERMEFLGDAVLELVCSAWLYEHMEAAEGDLSKIRASLVCEEALSGIAIRYGLAPFLLLGKGAEKNGARSRKAILEDMVESIFGAVYLDGGMEEARKLIMRWVLADGKVDLVQREQRDAKTHLQEKVQMFGKSVEYKLEETSGPPHDPTFRISVWCDGEKRGEGIGHSKKEAEQYAAKEALELMNEEDIWN